MPYRDAFGQFAPSPVDKESMRKERTAEQRGDSPGRWPYAPSDEALLVYDTQRAGCNSINPCGFPGYEGLYGGSYETYRWMLQHPILRLVRSIAVGPIGVSTWEYEKADASVSDDLIELVKKTFDPIRIDLLNDFFGRGRDYGWAGGEPIWEFRDGMMWLMRVKPLVHEHTEVMRDLNGNFVGLRNNVVIRNEQYVDLAAPFKAWKYTYDSEAGYVYGRSWLENVRATAWTDWLDAASNLKKLTKKISGTSTIITSPAGTFKVGDKTVSYKENAEKVITALAGGAAGAWFPSMGLAPEVRAGGANLDALKVLSELAGRSLTTVNVLDHGSHSPAITGLLERMQHDEVLMFAGGLRPSRTGLEGTHGTKAEAGVHTDTGIVNSELDDTDFARQLQPLVNAVLVINKGENARDRVRINPPSLVNRMADVLKALLLAGVNNQAVVPELFSTIDVDKMLKNLNVPAIKTFDAAAMLKILEKQNEPKAAKPPGNVDPRGGRPKKET